jgi:hypothetical protein
MLTGDQVVGLVQEAFADVPAPSRDEVAHCEQCELFVQRFLVHLPSDWRRIADEDLAYESSALTAATPSAWRFLLPAYIVWHLNHYDRSTSNTVDHLISQLTRSESTDRHIAEGYEGLSLAQVRAVAAFLEFIAGQQHDPILANDAQVALASYWRERAA